MQSDRRTDHRHNVPAARELRGRGTPAEAKPWESLRGRRLDGLKFRRQHPAGPFGLDFCCVERRLAIELDGGIHREQREHDAEREALLATAGYRVLRVPNEAVLNRFPDVLDQIQAVARDEPPPRPPAPGRRAGWAKHGALLLLTLAPKSPSLDSTGRAPSGRRLG